MCTCIYSAIFIASWKSLKTCIYFIPKLGWCGVFFACLKSPFQEFVQPIIKLTSTDSYLYFYCILSWFYPAIIYLHTFLLISETNSLTKYLHVLNTYMINHPKYLILNLELFLYLMQIPSIWTPQWCPWLTRQAVDSWWMDRDKCWRTCTMPLPWQQVTLAFCQELLSKVVWHNWQIWMLLTKQYELYFFLFDLCLFNMQNYK